MYRFNPIVLIFLIDTCNEWIIAAWITLRDKRNVLPNCFDPGLVSTLKASESGFSTLGSSFWIVRLGRQLSIQKSILIYSYALLQITLPIKEIVQVRNINISFYSALHSNYWKVQNRGYTDYINFKYFLHWSVL